MVVANVNMISSWLVIQAHSLLTLLPFSHTLCTVESRAQRMYGADANGT